MIFFIFGILFLVLISLIFLFQGFRKQKSQSKRKTPIGKDKTFIKYQSVPINKTANKIKPIIDEPISLSIYWDAGDSRLSSEQIDQIKGYISRFEEFSGLEFTLIGKSDHTGNPSRNKKLARERAWSVSRLLQNQFSIKEDQIHIETYDSIFGQSIQDRMKARSLEIKIVNKN